MLTLQGYQNEEEVGEGIRLSGVPREEIWVTSKVSWKIRSSAALKLC